MDQHLKKTFQILEEKAATRCDICHQADLFDPISGTCQRCEPIATVALAQLAEEQAENFHPEPTPVQTPPPVVTSPLATYHPTLSARDRWLILREAFGLYHDHFHTFLNLTLRIEAPLVAVFLMVALFPSKLLWPVVLLLGIVLSLFPIKEMRDGSIICAVFDSLPDRFPSVERAIQFANRRNRQHLWSMWKVKAQRLLAAAAGFFLTTIFIGLILGHLAGPIPMGILTIFFGFWFSWLVLSHNAFYRQIIVLEGRSAEEACRRSNWLTDHNLKWISFLNEVNWLGMLLVAFLGLAPGIKTIAVGWLALCSPVAFGVFAGIHPVWFVALMALKILITPLLTITETLSYLVLRRRAEGMQFQFQYTKDEDERLKEFITQATRNLPPIE